MLRMKQYQAVVITQLLLLQDLMPMIKLILQMILIYYPENYYT